MNHILSTTKHSLLMMVAIGTFSVFVFADPDEMPKACYILTNQSFNYKGSNSNQVTWDTLKLLADTSFLEQTGGKNSEIILKRNTGTLELLFLVGYALKNNSMIPKLSQDNEKLAFNIVNTAISNLKDNMLLTAATMLYTGHDMLPVAALKILMEQIVVEIEKYRPKKCP